MRPSAKQLWGQTMIPRSPKLSLATGHSTCPALSIGRRNTGSDGMGIRSRHSGAAHEEGDLRATGRLLPDQCHTNSGVKTLPCQIILSVVLPRSLRIALLMNVNATARGRNSAAQCSPHAPREDLPHAEREDYTALGRVCSRAREYSGGSFPVLQ